MKEKILQMLYEAEDYVSGQVLCDRFQVSRTAVWKNINQLKKEGYIIEAVTNKGYILREKPDIITKEGILRKIDSSYMCHQIYYYDEIDSTNNKAKRLAEDGCVDGSLVVAEIQTSGKGRRGRSWSSPRGNGIWMTCVLKPQLEPFKASMITLVAAMGVREAIRSVTGLDAVIKWPNDIVINGKKVCGILTEMSAELDMINYIVVGIGINVNTKEFPQEISQVATSLSIEGGCDYNRCELIARFAYYFEKYYESFLVTGDLEYLREEYNSRLVNINNKIKVLEPGNEYVGTSQGINAQGELLVTDMEGNTHIVRSGEVSVRGIYGYV